ncbi:hypothetical protein PG994_011086 [Apiospora phragmitis]|uniref:Uncharacterized protein n=1 Tax=Apiospora phragmitis TaxID=2905665 RepID=A0ABR1TU10_9PEZI
MVVLSRTSYQACCRTQTGLIGSLARAEAVFEILRSSESTEDLAGERLGFKKRSGGAEKREARYVGMRTEVKAHDDLDQKRHIELVMYCFDSGLLDWRWGYPRPGVTLPQAWGNGPAGWEAGTLVESWVARASWPDPPMPHRLRDFLVEAPWAELGAPLVGVTNRRMEHSGAGCLGWFPPRPARQEIPSRPSALPSQAVVRMTGSHAAMFAMFAMFAERGRACQDVGLSGCQPVSGCRSRMVADACDVCDACERC